MTKGKRYGQYCPLSMAATVLGTRWTLLVLRELLEGSTGFNEIARGVPLMSRTLLSQRLRELDAAGIVTRYAEGRGRPVSYRLTPAGAALGPVVRSVAEWGQAWIDTEPSLEDIDTDFLMWDIRRNAVPQADFPSRFVVQFHFSDAPEKKTDHWLIFEGREVDVCYIDPGYEVDIVIESPLREMVSVWMGWTPIERALDDGSIVIAGPLLWVLRVREWLGLSSVASIKKEPPNRRVLRPK